MLLRGRCLNTLYILNNTIFVTLFQFKCQSNDIKMSTIIKTRNFLFDIYLLLFYCVASQLKATFRRRFFSRVSYTRFYPNITVADSIIMLACSHCGHAVKTRREIFLSDYRTNSSIRFDNFECILLNKYALNEVCILNHRTYSNRIISRVKRR